MINLRKLRPTRDTSKKNAQEFLDIAAKENWPEDTTESLFKIAFGDLHRELLTNIKLTESFGQ